MPHLKRRSDKPLYAQVEALLIERIGKNYRPGELLPTQQALAEMTGASLITVKRALYDLRRKGLIESTRGRGTTVCASPIMDNHSEVSSWTDSIRGLGAVPGTASSQISVRVPPQDVATRLKLKVREKTVVIRRVRTMNDQPICIMTNEIPLKLVPGLPRTGLTSESLYECLARDYQLHPVHATEEVMARASTTDEKGELGHSTDIVLVVTQLNFQKNERPMELSIITAASDRYQYRVQIFNRQLGRQQGGHSNGN